MKHRIFITGLAAVTAMALSAAPLTAFAAPAERTVYTGSAHIYQFGEYDITAAVSVENGKISGVDVSGEHFQGNYISTNQSLLEDAKAVTQAMIGLSAGDAEAIDGIDAVSGATYSSRGIQAAVLNALGLTAEKQDPEVDVPEALNPGTYTVQISAVSHVVNHSLVANASAPATLTVAEDGGMTLSFTMVSGSAKEPLYVLAFNGWRTGEGALSLQGVTAEQGTANGRTVVTDVCFPLTEPAADYQVNCSLYVPAMANVNGTYTILEDTVTIENGTFDVDVSVTPDWSTLTTCDYTQGTRITATVKAETGKPDHTIIVPEETPGTPGTGKDNGVKGAGAVKTGDEAPLAAAVGAFLLAGAAGAALLTAGRKKQNRS